MQSNNDKEKVKEIMKKSLIFLLLLTYLNCASFNFTNNKTESGSLDSNFLKKMQATFQCDVFVETGTYDGKTARAAAPFFREIHTVELHEDLFKNAQSYLGNLSNIKIYRGASAKIIKKAAPQIKGRILFWLDAHYSGEGTAMSNDNPYDPQAITPICQELKAIKKSNVKDCVILIDDIRGFGSVIDGVEYLGCWAYPSIQEVCALCRKINHNFEFALLGDTLLMYDATKYSPPLSAVVRACTQSRLYDGKNFTDQQLIEHEKVIMNAQNEEKAFIADLYKKMTDYKDPLFHHDLWYGLTALDTQNWQEALGALSKVPNRLEYFSKSRRKVSKSLRYDHWRIEQYLDTAEYNLKRSKK